MKPDKLRMRIARIMADGRERTRGDLLANLEASATQIGRALSALRQMGLLTYADLNGVGVWKATTKALTPKPMSNGMAVLARTEGNSPTRFTEKTGPFNGSDGFRRMQVLEYIRRNGATHVSRIRDRYGTSGAKTDLPRLVEAGKIKRVSVGVYALSEAE